MLFVRDGPKKNSIDEPNSTERLSHAHTSNFPPTNLDDAHIQADDTAASSTADEMVGDSSILKYEDPVLARPNAAFDMTMGHDSLPQYVSLYASNERRPVDSALRLTGTGAAASGTPRNNRRSHGGGDENAAILKALLPNKEYVDEAGSWVQAVRSQHLEGQLGRRQQCHLYAIHRRMISVEVLKALR